MELHGACRFSHSHWILTRSFLLALCESHRLRGSVTLSNSTSFVNPAAQVMTVIHSLMDTTLERSVNYNWAIHIYNSI